MNGNHGIMTPSGQKLEILYFTPYFQQTLKEAIGFSPAVAEDLCTVTTDPTRHSSADVILFHIPNMKKAPEIPKPPGQLWVGMSMESNANYPLQIDPAFMAHFDLRMNFRADADIQMIYFHPAHVQDLFSPTRWKFRQAPAVYMASNNYALNNRYQLVEEIMRHMRVDSYGKSQQNRKIRNEKGRETKLHILSRYLFYFAFENSNCVDYVSEKLFDGLIAGTVPVYLGAPNVDEYLPADNCIINASDFSSGEELARHLISLSKNRREYNRYLEWKKRPLRKSFLDRVEREKIPGLRRLCLKVLEMKGSSSGLAL